MAGTSNQVQEKEIMTPKQANALVASLAVVLERMDNNFTLTGVYSTNQRPPATASLIIPRGKQPPVNGRRGRQGRVSAIKFPEEGYIEVYMPRLYKDLRSSSLFRGKSLDEALFMTLAHEFMHAVQFGTPDKERIMSDKTIEETFMKHFPNYIVPVVNAGILLLTLVNVDNKDLAFRLLGTSLVIFNSLYYTLAYVLRKKEMFHLPIEMEPRILSFLARIYWNVKHSDVAEDEVSNKFVIQAQEGLKEIESTWQFKAWQRLARILVPDDAPSRIMTRDNPLPSVFWTKDRLRNLYGWFEEFEQAISHFG